MIRHRPGRSVSGVVGIVGIINGASLIACGERSDRPEPLPAWMLTADATGVPASSAATMGYLARDDLRESSGAVASTIQPGVVFTINDSGHEPLLYATDATGADRGTWRVTSAANDDWESVAIGPCGHVDHAGPESRDARSCIYIGDTGDNGARKSTRIIYRVPEPFAERAGYVGNTPAAERLAYRYSDGPQDVEALYVGPRGDIFLISKRSTENPVGKLRPARLYHLQTAAWTGPNPAMAQLVDSLPIVPGSAPWRAITDASLAPDRRHLAVRTYTQVFVFAADSATGRIVTTTSPAVCNVAGLRVVGEGVAWADASGMLILTSEGKSAPIHRVRCPLPRSTP